MVANVLLTGGGLKGITLPPRLSGTDSAVFQYGPGSFHHSYGMQELSTALPKCASGRYHCPPWIVLLPLDEAGEKLVDTSGPVTARFAFIDLLADGHWGGLMSGDQVQIDFAPANAEEVARRSGTSSDSGTWAMTTN